MDIREKQPKYELNEKCRIALQEVADKVLDTKDLALKPIAWYEDGRGQFGVGILFGDSKYIFIENLEDTKNIKEKLLAMKKELIASTRKRLDAWEAEDA